MASRNPFFLILSNEPTLIEMCKIRELRESHSFLLPRIKRLDYGYLAVFSSSTFENRTDLLLRGTPNDLFPEVSLRGLRDPARRSYNRGSSALAFLHPEVGTLHCPLNSPARNIYL